MRDPVCIRKTYTKKLNIKSTICINADSFPYAKEKRKKIILGVNNTAAAYIDLDSNSTCGVLDGCKYMAK